MTLWTLFHCDGQGNYLRYSNSFDADWILIFVISVVQMLLRDFCRISFYFVSFRLHLILFEFFFLFPLVFFFFFFRCHLCVDWWLQIMCLPHFYLSMALLSNMLSISNITNILMKANTFWNFREFSQILASCGLPHSLWLFLFFKGLFAQHQAHH